MAFKRQSAGYNNFSMPHRKDAAIFHYGLGRKMAGLMEGKRVLVTGVRNKWSIAWHAALSIHNEGAQIAFSVFGDREAGGVTKLLRDANFEAPILNCDATDEAQVEAMFSALTARFDGKLDGLLHGIAFANKDELGGEFIRTSKAGFTVAHESSVYSLVMLARGARPLMQAAGGGKRCDTELSGRGARGDKL